MKELPEGKLPLKVLDGMLRSLKSGTRRSIVVVPPNIGIDVGITRTRGRYLVSSSDPITGTDSEIGWHAVNVSANDVATSGIMPECLTVVGLFPPGFRPSQINFVMREIDETASSLGIAVTGGHTEITLGLAKPVIIVTCFGSGDKFTTSANAKSEDSILMTKTAGIEGTAILGRIASVKEALSRTVANESRRLGASLSVVNDARTAFRTGRVHAMHDVTEGGVLGAVAEMAISSKLDFEICTHRIPVHRSTQAICEKLELDPTRLIGSGSLLIAANELDVPAISRALSEVGVKCTEIGRFPQKSADGREPRGFLVSPSGERTELKDLSIQDELWVGLARAREVKAQTHSRSG